MMWASGTARPRLSAGPSSPGGSPRRRNGAWKLRDKQREHSHESAFASGAKGWALYKEGAGARELPPALRAVGEWMRVMQGGRSERTWQLIPMPAKRLLADELRGNRDPGLPWHVAAELLSKSEGQRRRKGSEPGNDGTNER